MDNSGDTGSVARKHMATYNLPDANPEAAVRGSSHDSCRCRILQKNMRVVNTAYIVAKGERNKRNRMHEDAPYRLISCK